MVRQCGLHLISKLRHDAAMHFVYQGAYAGKGPPRKYSDKVNYDQLPKQYLVETSTHKQIETRIYQAEMLHHEFAQKLNLVILHKTHLITGACAHVILFSSDLQLSYDKIIDYYRLRFQPEFNFRDAKQYWGLEDWMNIQEVPLTNALNLSLFMVNVSQVLLTEFRKSNPQSSDLNLKAYCRAAGYFEETLKMLPKKPEPILISRFLAGLSRWAVFTLLMYTLFRHNWRRYCYRETFSIETLEQLLLLVWILSIHYTEGVR